ncbi:hypothetical protein MRB53_017492 [Persea americana]|uniref:Uncharacterized protein n=1 Tax=Persea americana TaxID=3435 RepID=A0ACC2M5S0_PERAE|nr:hypothetical protein MRB53_017492 [Persea americana]
MDDQDTTSHHVDPSRPILGFPLGIALLIIVIFCLSGFFSCCYHWDKLRALRNALSSPSDSDSDTIHSPSKSSPSRLNSMQDEKQSLPVIMPGDKIPTYIAWPCPREASPQPLPQEKLAIEVQVPPPPS